MCFCIISMRCCISEMIRDCMCVGIINQGEESGGVRKKGGTVSGGRLGGASALKCCRGSWCGWRWALALSSFESEGGEGEREIGRHGNLDTRAAIPIKAHRNPCTRNAKIIQKSELDFTWHPSMRKSRRNIFGKIGSEQKNLSKLQPVKKLHTIKIRSNQTNRTA